MMTLVKRAESLVKIFCEHYGLEYDPYINTLRYECVNKNSTREQALTGVCDFVEEFCAEQVHGTKIVLYTKNNKLVLTAWREKETLLEKRSKKFQELIRYLHNSYKNFKYRGEAENARDYEHFCHYDFDPDLFILSLHSSIQSVLNKSPDDCIFTIVHNNGKFSLTVYGRKYTLCEANELIHRRKSTYGFIDINDNLYLVYPNKCLINAITGCSRTAGFFQVKEFVNYEIETHKQ